MADGQRNSIASKCILPFSLMHMRYNKAKGNNQLASRPVMPSLYDSEARKKPFSTDQATFEAVVGTAIDEVAVAPGVLHQSWTKKR